MQKNNRKIYLKLFLFSLLSRIIVLVLSIFFYAPYDLSYSLNQENSLFQNLIRWDAVHFLNISYNGYTSEHSTAFFPLYPQIIKTINKVVKMILDCNIFTTGILFNNLLFMISSLIFYDTLCLLYKNENLDNSSGNLIVPTLLFIFNPSSIIYSSMYSEPLYTFLFLLAINQYLCKKYIKATITFMLSNFCRSTFFVSIIMMFHYSYILSILTVLPTAMYQLYIYTLFLQNSNVLHLYTIPYLYVQKIYWNQGFLKFYNFKNIVNGFIGLFPMITLGFIVLKNNTEKYSNPFIMKLNILLYIKLFLLFFFFHWNMAMRFISFNPMFYVGINNLFKGSIPKWFIKIYLTYGVLYIFTFTNYWPPA